jgi:hypothetical protein
MPIGSPAFSGVDLQGQELPLMALRSEIAASESDVAGYGIFDRPPGEIGALTISFKPSTPSLH